MPENCHLDIRSILNYWRSIHPEHGLPGRQHLRPQDIKQVLARVSLIDVVGDPPRFLLRLVGTGVVGFRGSDHTGDWLDECFPGFGESKCSNDFSKLLATARPVWRRGPPSLTHQKEYHDVERVYLPLARDGERVDMILGLYVFHGLTIDSAEHI